MPRVMLRGKVIARAMGTYKLGFALGAASFMAAGTAMYDALAARMANKKRLPGSAVIAALRNATIQPLTSGTTSANSSGDHPLARKLESFSRW